MLISVLYHQWRKARETYEQAISMWREYKEKEVLYMYFYAYVVMMFLKRNNYRMYEVLKLCQHVVLMLKKT